MVHAIEGHHNDVEPRTIVACLVQAAGRYSCGPSCSRGVEP